MTALKTRVAVLGASGYSGGELCALLARHPAFELVALQGSAGRTEATPFSALHPSLRGRTGPACEPLSMPQLANARPDVVFLASPNETSAELAPTVLELGARVIDLSGAYRFADPAIYPRWYGFEHPHKKLLAQAVYSVPELLDEAGRSSLRQARIIANPGCYATSVILALRPIAHLLHASEAVVADCKSGVSGAGKRAETAYSFTELANNFKAYATTGHRHEPEMRHALGLPDERPFVFVPHLLPVARGILSTLHVPLRTTCEPASLVEAYAEAYHGAGLVGVRAHGELPELTDVVGTPRCEIGLQLLAGGRRALVVSVLDNLLKGAASQAVQNLNLASGLPDTTGLL
jgi:N-acetyl-gamma-glutamyl-phosphate reductase